MLKQNLFRPLFFAATLFLFTACSKTGPAGATGPAGTTGPAGPTGPQGNANVFVDTFSIKSAQWAWNSFYEFQTGTGGYTEYFTRYYDATFTSITQNILNTGEVMVYFTPNTTGNTNQWAPLAYQFTDASGNFNYNVCFETMPGKVRLHYFFVQTVSSATIPTLSTYTIATYKFKIVAVSGTISTGMKQAGVNTASYSDVSKYLGL
ncbi:MAG TPA: collagen-like protein [Puia sp.]|jgi:hypothetical protein